MTIGTSGPYSFSYDPLMRMATIPGSRYLRFGDQLIGEYSNGNVAGRYVPGAGLDEPVAAISGSGVRDWRIADERGSIMAHSDASGAAPYVNRYDEYGRESTTQYGRFGFTGLPRLTGPLLDARNRLYHAELGRFLQSDPIGYGSEMNIYAYVGGDPVNRVDPLGTSCQTVTYGKRVYVNGIEVGVIETRVERQGSDCFTSQPRQAVGPAGGGGSGKTPGKPAVDQKRLAEARKNMIRICAAAQLSSACAEAKARLSSLEKEFHSEHPLPPVPEFEDERPEGWRLLIGLAGCVTSALPGPGTLEKVVGAAGCVTAADEASHYLIPNQRRKP